MQVHIKLNVHTNEVNISYLYHNDWSSISIEIWLNVCKQDAHPAIHSGNILYVNNITHSNRKLTNKK